MNQAKIKILEEQLLKCEQWEAIGPIFFYLANTLQKAPDEKIDEFFEHFESGVRDYIRRIRIIKIVPRLKDY